MNIHSGFFLLVSLSVFVYCSASCPADCKCYDNIKKVSCDCENKHSITDIPTSVPSDTRLLDLAGCLISKLTNETFKNLRSLVRIDLKQQKTGALSIEDGTVFQGLENLTSVYLDGNSISEFPSGLFANLTKLKTVSFTDNPLTNLPDDLFENSSNVQYLSAGSTQLNKDVLFDIGQGKFGRNLNAFAFPGTPIQNLQDDFFSGLPLLKHIRIEKCEIEHIGEDIFKGTQVSLLELNENPIKTIHENAFRDTKITTFRCKNCHLTSKIVFGFIKKMSLLSTLNLENNNLTYIEKNAFTGLSNLFTITLKNNSIESIEENPFVALKSCSSNCPDLSDNPLKCDCKLAWIKKWAEDQNINKESLKCQSPNKVAGKNISQLKLNEFCCYDANKTTCSGKNGNNGINGVSGMKYYQALLVIALVSFILY